MAKSVMGALSLIGILLALIVFIIPVILGSSDYLVLFFSISFGLLVLSFVFSLVGIKQEDNFGLSNFSLVVSVLFLLFLLIGALIA